MKAIALAILALTGCYSSRDNEVTGQVKRVVHVTPIICPNYAKVDLSMGVMRNGVGSMSHEDVWLYVPNAGDALTLEAAAKSGAIVTARYDVERIVFCREDHALTSLAVAP